MLKKASLKKPNSRITVLYIVIILCIIGLLWRLIHLQIIVADELREKAKYQQQKTIKIASKRGLIVDRKNSELAIDLKSYSLFAQPDDFKDSCESISNKLSPILKEDPKNLLNILKGKNFRWIKRKFDESVAKQIRKLRIPGLGLIEESKRIYPQKTLAANLIGFTGIDNQGLSGLEHSFDYFLRGGFNEEEEIRTDALGQEILRANGIPTLFESHQANKVILTIDKNIQYVAEKELSKGVKDLGALRGCAIVMNVKTGELFALATYPTYDPNDTTKRNWLNIKNWAVTDSYEPGSTMKIFTLAAALEDRKVRMDESILCPGVIQIEGWLVHDHGMSAGDARTLTPTQIIKVSSNVGISQLGRRMTPARHKELLEKFGFGKITGSGLSGEVPGIFPQLPWRPSKQSTICFGQSISVTPIQIVTAATAIANNGIRVEPNIIQKIVSPKGAILYKFASKFKRTMSKDVGNKMLKMMTEVVETEGGTGGLAKVQGYTIGGKTGTADKVVNGRYSGDVMASFLGILPIEDPQFIVFVLLDSPQKERFASITAAPIFQKIAHYTLMYLNIAPTKPEELKKEKM